MSTPAWPLVDAKDDGIRPAGRPDACFYCHQQVGQEHKRDCVIVTKLVRINYTYAVDTRVPHAWTQHDIEFHRNDSSWCANNAFREIRKHLKTDGCACNRTTAVYVETLDDTPTRELTK